MKGLITIKNGVLFVELGNKAPKYVDDRLRELGFSSINNKAYFLTRSMTESQWDYLNGLVKYEGLGMPYVPAAEKGFILDTVVPDSMGYETHIAIRKVKTAIGKPLIDYVREKLDYTEEQLIKSLAAEQVDSVALAIYNIEEKNQGIIIGDQTGIGKGRQAAAMIRYGIKQGKKPIFLSEKPNLFSDLYRDLVDINSADYKPFIVNARDTKTHIKDKSGKIAHQALPKVQQDKILESKALPAEYDFICATYSQFNQPVKKPTKPMFLMAMAKGSILILDEAHNASGSSNTGLFMQEVLRLSKGVVFLSATFAKRPDNMPIYAQKTSMSEANMSSDDLVEAIANGGVALQEVLSSQLVLEGQLIRRERSFEGVEVNYLDLTEQAEEHRKVSDTVTEIVRDIIAFQEDYLGEVVSELDKIAAAEGKEVSERQGTKKAGVDNQPYFSKVFNVINQLLFAIKAEAVADHTVKLLKQGFKPIVAFESTMGSFVEDLGSTGDIVKSDFSGVLAKGLDSVMRISTRNANGYTEKSRIEVDSLPVEAQSAYFDILHKIERISVGISVSPIDVIIQKIEDAGFSVGEVTGRKVALKYKQATTKTTQKKEAALLGIDTNVAQIVRRKKESVNDLFREFNDNTIDCLLINQSGSTGASAHAIVTDKVPESQVKKRVMVILQAELNINTEIQKRGRINRTGQVLKPRYDYLTSAIPAEKRLMMMLKKKLKSLDANTTSNQKSSEDQLRTDDFLNKYGSKVVRLYLLENPVLNEEIGNPLNFGGSDSDEKETDNDAHKVSGRIAILPVVEQERFHNDIIERYHDYVDYLKQNDEYDLEVETLNLMAETLEKKVTKAGKGGISSFGQDTFLEKCECNVLRKPFTQDDLTKELSNALDGKTGAELRENIMGAHNSFVADNLKAEILTIEEKYFRLIDGITEESKYKKLKTDTDKREHLNKRTTELNDAKAAKINLKTKELNNRKAYTNSFIRFFETGRGLTIPALGFDVGGDDVNGLCLGVIIDMKRKNPFAPSAVKVRIAVADSRKLLVLPLSGDTGVELERIQARTNRMNSFQARQVLTTWSDNTSSFQKSRRIRYIMTGNLLQAAAQDNGKLASYTTIEGDTKKGVLMPESWSPNSNKNGGNSDAYVVVSAKDATAYIKSLTQGAQVISENRIAIFRTYSGFKLIIPKGRQTQAIYKSVDVIKLVDNDHGFEMVSGAFTGIIKEENITKLLELFGTKFGVSFKVGRNIFEDIIAPKRTVSKSKNDLVDKAKAIYQADKKQFDSKLKKQREKPKTDDKTRKMRLLKLRAKAIIIKQKQAA